MIQAVTHRAGDKRRLSKVERDALTAITSEISEDVQLRYRKLRAQLQEVTLTDAEHAELTQISDRMEIVQTKRLRYMAELAKQQNMTLPTFMETYGLNAAPYA